MTRSLIKQVHCLDTPAFRGALRKIGILPSTSTETELARLRETVDRYREANDRLEREVRELRRELRSANRQIHLRQEMLNARRARTPESRRVIDAWRAHASDDGLTVALRDMQARPIRHVTGGSQ